MGDAGPCFVVSGRWDNVVSFVDIQRALDPEHWGTSAAILARPRVTPDIDANGTGRADTPASGQPVSLAVTANGRRAYVVNHSGRATPAAAAAFQHGHPGTVTVLDCAKALDPLNAGTTNAVAGIIDTGTAGPVGVALTPDERYLVVSSAEAEGFEDGGRHITLIDVASGRVLRQVTQRVDGAGSARAPEPCPHPAPHPGFGRFPNPNGIAVSPLDDGFIFSANGGTDDLSVINLRRALAGEDGAEIGRVGVQVGPFGIAVSPDGRLVAAASRESARTGQEGNTISLIGVEQACMQPDRAELARIQVGADDGAERTRPFAVAFTPDGGRILATCFRSGTVSLVDVSAALTGKRAEKMRIRLTTPDGGPGRPRGIAITPDGRYAAITGGAKGGPGSSVLFLVEIEGLRLAGCVAGVGNESYLLSVLPAIPRQATGSARPLTQLDRSL